MTTSNQPDEGGDLADFFAESEPDDSPNADEARQIGARIAEARRALDESAESLGVHLGVTPETVAAWESGELSPRANYMTKLSGVLGVSLSWLIMGRGAEPSGEPTELQRVRGELDAARARLDDVVNELAALDQRLAGLTDAAD